MAASLGSLLQRVPAPLPAAALGALQALSFGHGLLWPLQLLALAGLFWLAQRAGTARAAAWAGFFFGLGWFCVGVHWVYISMHVYGLMWPWLAALATLALAAYLALFPAFGLWLSWRWQAGLPARLLLLAPGAWALSEWLRGWVLTGFPWIASGYAHIDSPLAGYAPLLGIHGTTLLAAWVAGFIALFLSGARLSQAQRWLLGAACASIGLGGLALQRIEWTRPDGAPLTVRLVQGNIPQNLKFGDGGMQRAFDTHLALLGAAGQVDLAVLPESVFPVPVDYLPDHVTQALLDFTQQRQAALIFGVFVEQPAGQYYNSALALTPDAAPVQRYSKRRLVPFGEFIPWGFRWFVDRMQMPIGDQQRGAAYQPPLRVAGQRIAVNICYEDLFGSEIIRAWEDEAAAPTLLLNLSNLAWFDASIALDQHLLFSRMRALETGRPMLRATNTGATAIIDARGGVLARAPALQSTVLDGQVRGHIGSTPYVRWGDRPALVLIAMALLAGIWRGRREPLAAAARP